jgi:Tfp pilus assembly protein PilZ
MDSVQCLQGARQSLTRGLEALQAIDAPPALLDVAAPVARAMGILVQVETAPDGLSAERVRPALEALREGLGLLQLPELVDHPAAVRSMAAVAEALGTLVESVQRSPHRLLEAPEPFDTTRTKLTPCAPVTAKRHAAEHDLRAVDAALDAHGASNFYCGLAGGDVLSSGGLFVSTYRVLKVGEKVLLKISMPGGYEFLAKGVVAWTRSPRDVPTGPDAPPGFGAEIREIGEDGRRLIQRYVKNREPMLHDEP